MKIVDLDEATPLVAQFQEQESPIVLINTIFVPREHWDEFMEIFHDDASIMKASPGFISMQLHKGTADSQVLVNVAQWESSAALAAAFSRPEFQEAAARYPDGIVAYPHVYKKFAVDGLCGDQ